MAGTVITTQQPASPRTPRRLAPSSTTRVWFEITNLLTPGRTTPKPATLTRGREIGIRDGVRYAYTGNSTTSRAAVPGAMPVASC